MEQYPFPWRVEFYDAEESAWKLDTYYTSRSRALASANEWHHQTGTCNRVLNRKGKEIYRTAGPNERKNKPMENKESKLMEMAFHLREAHKHIQQALEISCCDYQSADERMDRFYRIDIKSAAESIARTFETYFPPDITLDPQPEPAAAAADPEPNEAGPFAIEVYMNGWKYDSEEAFQEDAEKAASELHEANGLCYRVIDRGDDQEAYRTAGRSEYTNR